jgi:hypothetical protein
VPQSTFQKGRFIRVAETEFIQDELRQSIGVPRSWSSVFKQVASKALLVAQLRNGTTSSIALSTTKHHRKLSAVAIGRLRLSRLREIRTS